MRAHEAGALHGDLGQRSPAWLRTPENVNALVPQLWPRTVVRTGDGQLEI
ncbi:MAG TPA: diaminopimelate decarboxylase, partial [Actinoplanes sp.]|nr:diaminopimelate decarboxylase [Actinoplanes sp.]